MGLMANADAGKALREINPRRWPPMASGTVDSMGPPRLRYSLLRKSSSESSPPPSPNPAEHPRDPRDPRSLPEFHPPSSSAAYPLDASSGNIRPAFVARQVTPPSPPNSLLLPEGGGEQMDPAAAAATPRHHRLAAAAAAAATPQDPEGQTPPSSFRDKFSRVFKAGHRRGSSGASISANPGYRRHQKDTSASTSTSNPLAQTLTASSRSSTAHNPGAEKPPFYAAEPAAGSRSSRTGFGGEVRVQIHRPATEPRTTGLDVQQQQQQQREGYGDGSSKYYEYYTKSSSAHSQDEEMSDDEREQQGIDWTRADPRYITPLPAGQQGGVDRTATLQSHHSSESQERHYAEEATSSFGFEGFHFGLPEDNSSSTERSRTVSVGVSIPESGVGGYALSSSPPRAGSPMSQDPSLYGSLSGKASSSVLNAPRSHSSLGGYNPSTRSPSGASRPPPMPRNISSGSAIRLPSSGSSRHSEDIARELKRLSKISAGSGMSGMAIVVPADGAADEEDESMRFTTEEKGKWRASSTAYVPGHQHTQSGATEWVDGPEERRSEERRSASEDNDDSRRLLRESAEFFGEKKLRSQVPAKDVIVHQADPQYD